MLGICVKSNLSCSPGTYTVRLSLLHPLWKLTTTLWDSYSYYLLFFTWGNRRTESNREICKIEVLLAELKVAELAFNLGVSNSRYGAYIYYTSFFLKHHPKSKIHYLLSKSCTSIGKFNYLLKTSFTKQLLIQ